MVRAFPDAPVRTLYLTTPLVRSIIQSNNYTHMRLMTAGTKVFTRQDPSKSTGAAPLEKTDDMEDTSPQSSTRPDVFRILGEGLPIVLPWISNDMIVTGDIQSLRMLMMNYYPLCKDFQGSFAEILSSRATGSIILRFCKGEQGTIK